MTSVIPTGSPRNCFLAQTTPIILGNNEMNPDVGGFAIGVTTIIYNICVSIIVALLAYPQPESEVQDAELVPRSNGHHYRSSTTETVALLAYPRPQPGERGLDVQDTEVVPLSGTAEAALAYPQPQSNEQGLGVRSVGMVPLSIDRHHHSPTAEPHSDHKFRISIFSGALQSSILGLFFLNHAILLSTLLATNCEHNAKLTLFEAHFAVAVTASPVTVYLVYKAFGEMLVILRRPAEEDSGRLVPEDISATTVEATVRAVTANAKKDVAKLSTYAVVLLGVLLPVSWMMLNVLISYSKTAFRNSDQCQNIPFGSWFEYMVLSNFVGVLDVMGRRDLWNDVYARKGLGIVSLIALWLWGILFVHHQRDIWLRIQRHRRTYRHWWWPFRYMRNLWTFVKTPWTGIARSHPWHFILVICCFHWSWVLGIYKGIKRNPTYVFSFGQALSVFSTILPILALFGVGVTSLTNIKRWTLGDICTKIKDEVSFFLTRQPNPWRPVPPPTLPSTTHVPYSFPRWSKVIIVTLAIIMNGGFVVWVYYYVQTGTKPNIRTSVNNPHKNWKIFSITLYVGGFLLGNANAELSFRLSNLNLEEKWPKFAQKFYRLCLLVLAFFICASPLFSPFLALALAQEYQWHNGCSSFAGRANLEGGAHIHKPPQVFLHLGSNIRLDYIITNGSDPNHWTFSLQNTTAEVMALADFPVIVQSVSYDMDKNATSATCLTSNISTPEQCMWGKYDRDNYFAFVLNDTLTNTEIRLRAEYREWYYSDDAPSFRLNYEDPDKGRVMETAVTKRSHCESLLVCLDSNRPSFETIVPLGLALWAEDAFASYCTTTGLVI